MTNSSQTLLILGLKASRVLDFKMNYSDYTDSDSDSEDIRHDHLLSMYSMELDRQRQEAEHMRSRLEILELEKNLFMKREQAMLSLIEKYTSLTKRLNS